MTRFRFGLIAVAMLAGLLVSSVSPGDSGPGAKAAPLRVGFGESDITPPIGKEHKPVYLAGFGKGRVAKSVHDPIMVRAVVLEHGDKKIAIASVDAVGLFLPFVDKVRAQLPGMTYVL